MIINAGGPVGSNSSTLGNNQTGDPAAHMKGLNMELVILLVLKGLYEETPLCCEL